MIPLKCKVQNYDWGKVGSNSQVSQLASKWQNIEENKTYAELWMGTHPNGPSSVVNGEKEELFSDWLKSHPGSMGDEVLAKWPEGGWQLPFLFKILSIAKALSIQAHPDKELAKVLHEKRRDLYKDPNHKPELAMALTEMELLCSFRKISEIKRYLKEVPEFRNIVGEEVASTFEKTEETDTVAKKASLKQLFTSLMHANESDVAKGIQQLIQRIQTENISLDEFKLIIRLNQQFPNDVGIFCVFLLNFIRLQPGEAVFLPANEPHSYISGDCAECMADSDNVVRAGLTPKPKDKETLCSMLTYNDGLPEILKGTRVDEHTVYYAPPIEEFLLERIELDKERIIVKNNIHGGSILLVYEGKGSFTVDSETIEVERGNVVFFAANTKMEIKTTEHMTLLRCRCNCFEAKK